MRPLLKIVAAARPTTATEWKSSRGRALWAPLNVTSMRLRSNGIAGQDSVVCYSSFGSPKKRRALSTSEAAMRDETIFFLAAASSIMFLAAGIVRAKTDLHQRRESTPREYHIFMTTSYRPDLRSNYLESIESQQEFAITTQCCSSAALQVARMMYTAARNNPIPLSDPMAHLGLGRSTDSPRMITWSACSMTASGSALSIYSRSEKSPRFLQGSATREDERSAECVVDDDGDNEE
jgi:hypothetical protein